MIEVKIIGELKHEYIVLYNNTSYHVYKSDILNVLGKHYTYRDLLR